MYRIQTDQQDVKQALLQIVSDLQALSDQQPYPIKCLLRTACLFLRRAVSECRNP